MADGTGLEGTWRLPTAEAAGVQRRAGVRVEVRGTTVAPSDRRTQAGGKGDLGIWGTMPKLFHDPQ